MAVGKLKMKLIKSMKLESMESYFSFLTVMFPTSFKVHQNLSDCFFFLFMFDLFNRFVLSKFNLSNFMFFPTMFSDFKYAAYDIPVRVPSGSYSKA